MKTRIFLFISIIGLEFQHGLSQSQAELKPTLNLISVSIGFGGYTGDFITYSTSQSIPLLKFFYERNVATVFDNCYLGIGGELSYRNMTITSSDIFGDSYKASFLYIAPRVAVNYVFEDNPKMRIYTSYSLGKMLITASSSDPYNNINNSFFAMQFYLGGRYIISNSLACFAEIGYGMSYLNLGMNVRF